MWIKEKFGLRKFRLRELAKARVEALWGVLTYDVMQWMRLSWRRKNRVAARGLKGLAAKCGEIAFKVLARAEANDPARVCWRFR